MLAGNEVIHHARLQRPGSKQRDERHQIIELVRPHAFDQVAHATGLKLKHSDGLCLLQQLEGSGVLHRDAADFELGAIIACIDDANGPVDNRQCFQTKEVELNQADRLDIILVELRDRIGAAVFTIEWRIVSQVIRRNNHATGMLAGIAHQALE